jgi:medium-chain acyl-[acyl-carrier-protein] hydrolase
VRVETPARSEGTEYVWTESYRVRASELDAAGYVSPIALCNYVQETAGGHADRLGWSVEQLLRRGLTWVLARLHLVVGRYPRWRDALALTTWPSGALRAYALREFHIVDAAQEEIGVATSAWLLVDARTRRPRRPPTEIVALCEHTPARVLDDQFARLDEGALTSQARRYEVGHSDLDVNGHANNVCLTRCALDAVGAELLRVSELSELELEFRAECAAGDVIESHVTETPGDSLCLNHRLIRAADRVDVSLARTRWRARR